MGIIRFLGRLIVGIFLVFFGIIASLAGWGLIIYGVLRIFVMDKSLVLGIVLIVAGIFLIAVSTVLRKQWGLSLRTMWDEGIPRDYRSDRYYYH